MRDDRDEEIKREYVKSRELSKLEGERLKKKN